MPQCDLTSQRIIDPLSAADESRCKAPHHCIRASNAVETKFKGPPGWQCPITHKLQEYKRAFRLQQLPHLAGASSTKKLIVTKTKNDRVMHKHTYARYLRSDTSLAAQGSPRESGVYQTCSPPAISHCQGGILALKTHFGHRNGIAPMHPSGTALVADYSVYPTPSGGC